MVARVGADQEVPDEACRLAFPQLEHVALRLRDDVVGVALDVGLLDRMADDAGNTFLIADEVG